MRKWLILVYIVNNNKDLYSNDLNLSSYFPNCEEHILNSLAVNNSGETRPTEQGSKTDISFLHFIESCGYSYQELRNSAQEIKKIPFTSRRKRCSTILKGSDNKNRLFIKGASELLLESCTHYHKISTTNNEIVLMNEELRNKIQSAIEEMGRQALRTILFAYKILEDADDTTTKDDRGKNGLTFLMIAGVKDILRREVPDAISNCNHAGIKVIMVTGDNKSTAETIAKECGILKDYNKDLVLDGFEFNQLIGGVICAECKKESCYCFLRNDKIQNFREFKKITENLVVLARCRPEDKYALITGLKERGHVVAVTGDGTNDSLALKKADVGFAMGICGTEIAREASDIILLDDNFSSIIKAVLWGRNIYDSVRKFLQFQLTVNLVAVILTFIGAALLKQDLLTPIQMIWINLVMDSFASLALATEPPTFNLLLRQPHSKKENIVSRKMLKHIIGQALMQIILLLIIVFAGELFIPEYSKDHIDAVITKDLTMLSQYPTATSRVIRLNGWNVKYNGVSFDVEKPKDFTTVCSGRANTINVNAVLYPKGEKLWKGQDYKPKEQYWGPSRHMTFLFNTFVFLQIFNFFNARKLNDEFNVLKGFCNNSLFIIVVTFGDKAFHCYKNHGLDAYQWLFSIVLGSLSLFWSIILKLIPENLFCKEKRKIIKEDFDYVDGDERKREIETIN